MKRKTYNGPNIELILGEELPVTSSTTQPPEVAKDVDFLPHVKD